IHAPAIQMRLRLALIAPVELGILEQIVIGRGHAEPPAPFLRPCLDHPDPDRRILRQSRGEDAAGGAAADDDIVIFALAHRPLLRKNPPVYSLSTTLASTGQLKVTAEPAWNLIPSTDRGSSRRISRPQESLI